MRNYPVITTKRTLLRLKDVEQHNEMLRKALIYQEELEEKRLKILQTSIPKSVVLGLLVKNTNFDCIKKAILDYKPEI